jgi:SAM-dependent methyltransferase
MNALSRKTEFEKQIANVFNKRFLQLGAQPEASLWFCKTRQRKRFETIARLIFKRAKSQTLSISDIGCGYGAFYNFLMTYKSGVDLKYTGYDIASSPIEYCLDNYLSPSANFICGSRKISEWRKYYFNELSRIFQGTKSFMIFNITISSQARISPRGIFYENPNAIEEFCNSQLGNTTSLTTPGLPHEKTFCVAKCN